MLPKRTIGVLLIGMLLATGSAVSQSGDSEDVWDTLREISQGMDEALEDGDAERMASFYTADAVIIVPGMPTIRGRDAVREYWAYLIDAGLSRVHVRPDEVHASAGGIVETGTARVEGTMGALPGEARYITIWKRVDGRWLIHRDVVTF